MHVDVVAQAASQETSTVHHVEGKGKEHQACMGQQSSSATCLRRQHAEQPALRSGQAHMAALHAAEDLTAHQRTAF